MKITEALKIHKEEKSMISIVGGGGKTSIMYRLASELKLLHKKVLVTTTTAVYYPGQAMYDKLFLWDEKEGLPAEVQSPEQGSITVIGRHVTEENKLKGIPGEWVDVLYGRGTFDAILVEADGAKGRPIKAPDYHEPVIPACSTKMIGVIGFDSYLKEIGPDSVHRPHILARLTEKKLGDMIEDEVFIKLSLSHEGIFKNCPPDTGKVLFINKVEKYEQYITAARIGNSVLKGSSDIEKVLIGSMLGESPVQAVMERTMG